MMPERVKNWVSFIITLSLIKKSNYIEHLKEEIDL